MEGSPHPTIRPQLPEDAAEAKVVLDALLEIMDPLSASMLFSDEGDLPDDRFQAPDSTE